MTSKLEMDIELKTPAEKLWKNLKEFATVFPKALPDMYEKIDVIEGDGRSAGTVIAATLKASESLNPVALVSKERIEMVDEEKKILIYKIVEGEIMKNFKNFKASCFVSRNKSDDGTIMKYSAEFDKANAEVDDPAQFVRLYIVKVFHGLDAYLLKE